MNRLPTLALMLGLVLGTAACDDEFLTTVPQDVISSGSFWTSERDFLVALNGAYERMIGQDLNIMYFDGTTDIGYSGADWMRQHEYAMGRQDALSGWSAGQWAQMYTGISRANEILAQFEAVGSEVLSPEAATVIEAQARFLRGYFYHELLWMFGAVPLFTHVPTVEEAREAPRASREEVYTQIMSDLEAAASGLPDSWSSAEWGRATRGAALAYQARTALYEATWQEYQEGSAGSADAMYRTAAEAAQAVTDLGVYQLHPSFRDLFTYAGERSSEVIFDYVKVSGQNGWWAWVGFAPSSMGGNVDVTPTRALVDMFYMTDGLPIDESPMYDSSPPVVTYDGSGNPVVESLGMYANRDPRLYGTVIFPGAEFNGTTYNSYPACGGGTQPGYCSPTSDRLILTDFNNTHTGYIARKYVDPTDEADPWNSGLNLIKMRYADVLLMYAEAKVELGELDGSVSTALNALRDRVGMPNVNVTGMGQAEALDVVRHERAVELAWEGLRLADIRRWAIAEDVMNGRVEGIEVREGGGVITFLGQWVRSFQAPRDYLWPIPATERDLNPGLVQNPGY